MPAVMKPWLLDAVRQSPSAGLETSAPYFQTSHKRRAPTALSASLALHMAIVGQLSWWRIPPILLPEQQTTTILRQRYKIIYFRTASPLLSAAAAPIRRTAVPPQSSARAGEAIFAPPAEAPANYAPPTIVSSSSPLRSLPLTHAPAFQASLSSADPVPAPTMSTMPRLHTHAAGEHADLVIQAALGGGLPQAAGLLGDGPSFLIYVNVGDWKEWLLQFAPRSGAAQGSANGTVVTLSAGPAVEAPYPSQSLRPEKPVHNIEDYVLLRGRISASGMPEEFAVVDDHLDPELERALLEAIREWRFRPAKLDGVPVEVEAVIAVPAHTE